MLCDTRPSRYLRWLGRDSRPVRRWRRLATPGPKLYSRTSLSGPGTLSDIFDRLNTTLADRYAIQEELGAGGMATVYLAKDLKHHRQVAVKVLRPELAAALGAERFLREIEIAANLAHPHILPLYDSGEADGFLYYVMPYVEGESLRDRITRERQLAIDDAVEITKQVAGALAYAHKRDVVHRDIKPENILLQEEHAVVADFGIARAISAAGGEQLTETGLAVGTPAYMSPEQASADQLDGRSDIYALGCVLYEMLAGTAPFTGATPQAVMARHAIDPVPSLSTVRATVPPVVETAVTKALAKVPADRFATAAEFAEALTRSDAVTTTATPVVAQVPAERSIAVLPFANMSADPENEYFCDGMTEEIINALTHVPGLEVAARTSSFTFKGKNAEIRTIGRTLNVSKVLEGSVRQAGTKLRVTAQLINVADGYHLWSERYDREMADVFAIQDEVAAAIVNQLKITLTTGTDSPVVYRGTDNLEAQQLYWRGRHCWNQRQLPEAIKYCQRAIEHDPKYALPYAGMADSLAYLAHYGLMPSFDAATKARGAAERAVSLAPDLADAHFSLGMVKLFFWEVFESEAEFEKAIELNPGHGLAHAYLAVFFATVGQRDEATRQAHRASEAEPLSSIVHAVAGIALYWAHEIEAAIDSCKRALELDPTMLPAVYMLGLSLSVLKRHTEAIATLEKAAEALPCPMVLMLLGGGYAAAGRTKEATDVLDRLLEQAKDDFVPAMPIGYIYAKLGQTDEALDWFAKGFDQRNSFVWAANALPGVEAVATDPRYTILLEKTGLGALAKRADSH